ncbi:hypothetical protein B0T24DRAFT_724380 [Lasiosphaeria ovina]|uniref:Uncharacterized protein n=1 Tax=Lasiosphaeria ovina TaxID=92902 RepID=A0AAE0MZC7_9PEZI|nr:hypothetical protein B0T24DRAFT_724380 [Lasiosphaeria ovina]
MLGKDLLLLAGHITNSFEYRWYDNLGQSSWLLCLGTCGRFVDIKHANELAHVLNWLESSESDEEGWIPELNPGTIRMLNVDPRNGVGLRCVPIFMEALRRRQVGLGRKCDFCLERFFEADFDTIGGWVDVCEGIEGDWMWQVFDFPLKLALFYDHPFHCCTSCLSGYMKRKTRRLQGGVVDNLPCPYPPYHRILSNDEIRLYADPETWKRSADHMRKEKNCQDNLPERPV